jgi:AcrR family transcriptional regulator
VAADPLAPAARSLRRDAAENRQRVLAAAREAFAEEGLEVGMDEIARRAGVGVGTVYRRFASKEELIDAAVAEAAASIRAVLVDAQALEDPLEGIRAWLFGIGELQVHNRGFLSRLMDVADPAERAELAEMSRRLLERAQRSGAVRADLAYDDLLLFFWSLRGVIERTWDRAPSAWRRFVELYLASLRPDSPPLEQPPVALDVPSRAASPWLSMDAVPRSR